MVFTYWEWGLYTDANHACGFAVDPELGDLNILPTHCSQKRDARI